MTVEEGDPAPGFTLPAAPGEQVDVGDLLGREPVVLLFFPLAFSPVCTEEMCTFAARWDAFAELDARIFAISVDSPFVTARFRDEEGLPFPVLSDFNRTVTERYGVVLDELEGLERVAQRAVFVAGRDGTVRWRWVADHPGREPPYDDVRAAVREAAA